MLSPKRFGYVVNILAAPARLTSSLSLSHHSFGSRLSDTLSVKNPGDLQNFEEKHCRVVCEEFYLAEFPFFINLV